MPFDIDIIQRGLQQTAYKAEVGKPVDTFLSSSLFGGAPIMGNPVDGVISYNFRRKSAMLADEAIFGADPNRVNFDTGFDTKFLKPAVFNDENVVDWHSGNRRVFAEGLEQSLTPEARIITVAADVRDRIADMHNMSKEKMAADMLLTGKVTVKDGGEQAMPISSSLLNVSGATLYTKPVETILGALKAIRKVNKGASGVKAIIMNFDDAMNLVLALGELGYKDSDKFELASITFQDFTANGAMYMGRLICGGVCEIYGYAGEYNANGAVSSYIPQGKAIVLTQPTVGSFGYGVVMAATAQGFGAPMLAMERTTLYTMGSGDNMNLHVQRQTSPLPIVTAIDSYAVLTGIPASRS
jgi:hypothetical protein